MFINSLSNERILGFKKMKQSSNARLALPKDILEECCREGNVSSSKRQNRKMKHTQIVSAIFKQYNSQGTRQSRQDVDFDLIAEKEKTRKKTTYASMKYIMEMLESRSL